MGFLGSERGSLGNDARFTFDLFSKHNLTKRTTVWYQPGLIYIRAESVGDIYRGADKSLARPTSRCILFDGENISFDASLVIYINSTNIPPIMIINRIYEHQNLLSL